MGTVEELKRKRDVLGLMNVLREFCERRDSVALASMVDRMTHRPGSTDMFLGSERVRVTDMVDDARAAAKALGELRDKRAVEVLMKALHQPLEVSIAAVVALGKIKDERAVEPLTSVLGNYALPVGKALREILGERSIDLFAKIVRGEVKGADGRMVRQTAVEELGKLQDKRAVESLIEVLSDEDKNLRAVATSSLGSFKDDRAVEALITALKDEAGEVRREAVLALGRIKDDRAVEPLIETLRESSSQLRRDAARVLTWMGDERAVAPLTRALEDDDGYVRMQAEKALDRIKRRITKK